MPAPFIRHLYQRAVLFPVTGCDPYGKFSVGVPVEIACRWNSTRTVSEDADGETIILDAQVVVATDVKTGSRMWLGKLSEFLGTGSALQPAELFEVKNMARSPDLKNRSQMRTLGLMRFHDRG